jgi:hypothetical protein
MALVRTPLAGPPLAISPNSRMAQTAIAHRNPAFSDGCYVNSAHQHRKKTVKAITSPAASGG